MLNRLQNIFLSDVTTSVFLRIRVSELLRLRLRRTCDYFARRDAVHSFTRPQDKRIPLQPVCVRNRIGALKIADNRLSDTQYGD